MNSVQAEWCDEIPFCESTGAIENRDWVALLARRAVLFSEEFAPADKPPVAPHAPDYMFFTEPDRRVLSGRNSPFKMGEPGGGNLSIARRIDNAAGARRESSRLSAAKNHHCPTPFLPGFIFDLELNSKPPRSAPSSGI
jgi:hypothetical protein